MKIMVLVKADKNSEAGVLPDESLLIEMGKFNEQLVKAGVMLAGDGLHPSSKGARIKIGADGKRTVIDGPFAEAKELIAGFWMIQAKSKEEAVEWFDQFCWSDSGIDLHVLLERGLREYAQTPRLSYPGTPLFFSRV